MSMAENGCFTGAFFRGGDKKPRADVVLPLAGIPPKCTE
jgi:hypothetical protein